MHVRQLEQETDARVSQKRRKLLSEFSQEANQTPEDQRENLSTGVTSEIWRRDEQVYDLGAEVSFRTPHAEDVSQHQNQEHAGPHEHLTGLVQETQQCQGMIGRISNCSISRWTRN